MISCARCEESVKDGTQKCPGCEYRPQKSMQVTGIIIFVIGLVFSVVLVGIPVAVFGAYRVLKGRDLTVESEYAL